MGQLVNNGEVIDGRYQIVRPIAQGGMGTVFLAEHWLIKRKVAIKVLHPELATDAVIVRRFMNEALAAGTLGHPNIVESTDMGFLANDVPYIVFEYLEGRVLAEEINRVRKLPVPRALAIAQQVASALDAAHRVNIVHRDLKSDNIFIVDKAGRDHVKVLDFGISRFLDATDKTALGSNLLGTPEFMAPEQVIAPERVDHRCDIYALGVLIYEMVTGAVPFVLEVQNDVEAAHALLKRVVHEPPPALVDEDAPPGLAELVAKLLAKQAEDRVQTMADVKRALHAMSGTRTRTPPTGVDISERTLSRAPLPREDLVREVQLLGKRWTLDDDDLVLHVEHRAMSRLVEVVAAAAEIADDMGMVPEVEIETPHLHIVLVRAATVADLIYAARLEEWLRENDW